MSNPCIQEAKIATIKQSQDYMTLKIDKIEKTVDWINENLSDIKENLNSKFSDLYLYLEKEKKKTKDDVEGRKKEMQEWSKKEFSPKYVEKIMLWLTITFWTAIIRGLVTIIFKIWWKLLQLLQ